MNQRENAVIRECLTACSHRKLQVLDPSKWNKVNPPPFRADDMAIDGVVWRENTGGAKYDDRNFVRFGIRGQTDIKGMFRGGQLFGFECKQGKGKRSPYQVWYHEFFGGLGMWVATVHSYEETLAALDLWRYGHV